MYNKYLNDDLITKFKRSSKLEHWQHVLKSIYDVKVSQQFLITA